MHRQLLNVCRQHCCPIYARKCQVRDPPNAISPIGDTSYALVEGDGDDDGDDGVMVSGPIAPRPSQAPQVSSSSSSGGGRRDDADELGVLTGRIKKLKGRYGFIRPDNGAIDIFFHFKKQFETINHEWVAGSMVKFTLRCDRQRGKYEATNMRVIA